jgi:hypothetical protein
VVIWHNQLCRIYRFLWKFVLLTVLLFVNTWLCNQDNGSQTYTLSVDYIWNFEKFDFPLYKMCFSFTCNYTGVNKSYCFLSVYIVWLPLSWLQIKSKAKKKTTLALQLYLFLYNHDYYTLRDDTVLLTYADQQISASQYLSTINLFNAFILVIVSVLIIKWYHDKILLQYLKIKHPKFWFKTFINLIKIRSPYLLPISCHGSYTSRNTHSIVFM